MKLPNDVRQRLVRRFQNKHRQWLLDEKDTTLWPLEINLGTPSEKMARLQPDGIRAWVAAWQQWQGEGIVWCTRHWRLLGTQRLPDKLVLQGPAEVAAWAGESIRWQRASLRFAQLITRWPTLQPQLPRYFDMLADYDESDFNRLIAMIEWINNNPHSNLYPRQLPVNGVDSKWLEKRKDLLSRLVATLRHQKTEDSLDFFQCCGLRAPPQLIRIRVLDQAIRNQLGGFGDISAPIEQLATLNIQVGRVLIVENLQTGLAFDDIPNTVVFMRLGYHVDLLAQIPWLTEAKCFYWGDLDTHGFAILNRVRCYLPNLQSVLMDEGTLLKHQPLWVMEKEPHSAELLPSLSEAEQAVYQAIKQQIWGQNIRLEQERIVWDYAVKVIAAAMDRD